MDDCGKKLIEQGARQERREIVKELEEWLNDPNDPRPVAKMIGCIKAHGEEKQGKIERATYSSDACTKINELIDAVNEMRGKI